MPPKAPKKKNEVRNDISRLDKAIKSGELPKVILLSGNTRYLLDHYKKKLVNMLAEPSDTMNFTRFESGSASPLAIVEMAGTLPFFKDNRLIFVEESGFFKAVKKSEDAGEEQGEASQSGGDTDVLTDYVKDPCPTTYLIFVEENVDSRKKLTKAIDAAGGYFVIGEFNDRMLMEWVVNTFKRYGKKLSKNVYDHFLERCGRDMDVLAVEMRKLADYLGDEEEVTADAVDAICIRSFESKVFEMIDDMMAGRTQAALAKYYDLLMLKEAQQKTRILIMRQYVRLAMVKEAMEKGQDATQLCSFFKVTPYVMGKLSDSVRNCQYEILKAAADECVELESACRNRSLGEKVGTEYMILALSTKYRII